MKHREKALELEGRFKDAEAAQDEAGCEENNYRSHCEPKSVSFVWTVLRRRKC